jgi:hypothetical protein
MRNGSWRVLQAMPPDLGGILALSRAAAKFTGGNGAGVSSRPRGCLRLRLANWLCLHQGSLLIGLR